MRAHVYTLLYSPSRTLLPLMNLTPPYSPSCTLLPLMHLTPLHEPYSPLLPLMHLAPPHAPCSPSTHAPPHTTSCTASHHLTPPHAPPHTASCTTSHRLMHHLTPPHAPPQKKGSNGLYNTTTLRRKACSGALGKNTRVFIRVNAKTSRDKIRPIR